MATSTDQASRPSPMCPEVSDWTAPRTATLLIISGWTHSITADFPSAFNVLREWKPCQNFEALRLKVLTCAALSYLLEGLMVMVKLRTHPSSPHHQFLLNVRNGPRSTSNPNAKICCRSHNCRNRCREPVSIPLPTPYIINFTF